MDGNYTFIYTGKDPLRLDKFLSEKISGLSRSQIQRLIKEGLVTIDGQPVLKNGFLLEDQGAQVEIIVPEPDAIDIVPEKRDLEIIYEDRNVLIINKPAGMVMHPSAGHLQGTLVHAALGHDPFIDGIGGKMRPGIVHRLDKDTSGVVIISKNDLAHRWLQKQFKDRETEKYYTALVDRHPPTDSGKIEAPIYRDPVNRKKMAIAPAGRGKHAITIFHTIKKFAKFSLLDVQILTGRTHQIRVHLASIGSPVAGDTVYGYSTSSIDIKRQFLHARSIKIRLPDAVEKSEFNAKLPAELEYVLGIIK